MKTTLLKIMCLALALVMVLGVAGCKSTAKTNGDDSFSEDAGDFDIGGGTDNSGGDTSLNDDVSDASSGTTTKAAIPNADSLSFNQLVAQMPSSLRGTTVYMYNWNPVKDYGADSVVTNFEKLTGIKVKWEAGGYDDYDQKIAAMINAGNSPDIIRFRDSNIHRMYLCQDIKAATGFDFAGNIWDQKVNSQYVVKKKLYAVNRKDTLFNQPYVMIYRKSMIEKYKFEDPYVLWKSGKWTWDAFINILKSTKDSTFTGDPWRTSMGIDYYYFLGKNLIRFDGSKFVNDLMSKDLSAAVKKLCDYRKSGYTSSAMRMPKDFENGSVLFQTYSAIATRRTNTSANIVQSKADDDLYCVPIPTIKGAENIQLFSELEAYGIPKGAKNPAAVYYFLRYFLDAANYDANTFFCNKQAYEVYKASMAKQTYFVAGDNALLDVVGTGGNLEGISDFVRQGNDFSQFDSERQKVNPKYDLAVKKANEVLAKMK